MTLGVRIVSKLMSGGACLLLSNPQGGSILMFVDPVCMRSAAATRKLECSVTSST